MASDDQRCSILYIDTQSTDNLNKGLLYSKDIIYFFIDYFHISFCHTTKNRSISLVEQRGRIRWTPDNKNAKALKNWSWLLEVLVHCYPFHLSSMP